MPERPIRLFGDPVLKTVSDPITEIDDRARALVADLVDSVQLPGRAGVAASQIDTDGGMIFGHRLLPRPL